MAASPGRQTFTMKYIFTLFIICLVFVGNAQWSSTTNQFIDSLHMPVCTAALDQSNSIVLRSYPDSGYFVIWEDFRAGTGNRDIYAQKYDKNGFQKWTADGVPVATGPDGQRFAYTGTNADYRNYSHACTDSAGGFYIAWDDDNITNTHVTNKHRVAVQHIRTDGTMVFPGTGYIVAEAQTGDNFQYGAPQLVADGNKGFFVGYIRAGYAVNDMFMYCLRDEGGTIVRYGGGQMNIQGINKQDLGPCGIRNSILDVAAYVLDFFIYADLQHGCAATMTLTQNMGGNERVFIGYNRLCRVKKDSKTTSVRRFTGLSNFETVEKSYKKDSVVRLYNYTTYYDIVTCGGGSAPLNVVTSYYVENLGEGYLPITNLVYGAEYTKATILPTGGNINAEIIACLRRDYDNTTSSVTNWTTRVYYRYSEIYDSIPYQLCSDNTNGTFAYNVTPPAGLDKMTVGEDTLLGPSVWDIDFALVSSGTRIFATTLAALPPTYLKSVLLQQLRVERVTANSFAVNFNTGSKSGIVIGKEISTGFSGANIIYSLPPSIAVDQRGNALFYIREYYRYNRASPIGDGAQLLWGAMGKPLGTGVFKNKYYVPDYPYAIMDPLNGSAVMSWNDDRFPPSTGNNIYMQHIDSLGLFDYLPPEKSVNPLPIGGATAFPAVLLGTSGKWSAFDAYNSTTGAISPVVEILDNYNLGVIQIPVYEYTQAPIRTYNGKAYLSRNYTIKVENSPIGGASINVRLFFTQAQFDALRVADPSINTPADLGVVKQPNATTTVPAAYTPVAGEEMLTPIGWKSVNGGYYLEVAVNGFSNFFIQKGAVPLPVTWLDVRAQWVQDGQARVTWLVAQEHQVKDYVVQVSTDGSVFTDGCTVNAAGQAQYDCLVPSNGNGNYYYRVLQRDFDGHSSYSKVVELNRNNTAVSYRLSPNPAGDYTTLHINDPINNSINNPYTKPVTLLLFNSNGAIVWRQVTVANAAGDIRIPLTPLPAGVYSLRVVNNNQVQTVKLIRL